jgi:transposase
MEACYCWQPIWNILEFEGYELKLAHPTKTRLIAEAKVKTDALDSERLAHLLRANLLPTAYVPPKEIRELRELVRLRLALVRERAAHKARLRAELAKRGIRFTSPFTKNARAFLLSLGVRRIEESLWMIEALGRRIRSLDAELRRRTKGRVEVRLLQTIPGIGEFSAVAILAEVGKSEGSPHPSTSAPTRASSRAFTSPGTA